jgi:tRNA(Ile)-lysidine synthase
MRDPSTLAKEVAARAREGGLLSPGDRVLVATSAGADSTALAALLVAARGHGLPLEIVLGHVDHGWRGPAEAAADRLVVGDLAARLGVHAGFAPPGPVDLPHTEDEARRFRYAALARLAHDHRCTLVATGHHLRDQAETFLLRLARGSGPAGLAGIPAKRPLDGGSLVVVRPVLHLDPASLKAYVLARGLPWREDATNADLARDRARVRARLVALEERGAALSRDLASAAQRFARALERRERAVGTALAPSLRLHAEARTVEVAIEEVAALPPGSISSVLRRMGVPLRADADGPWFTRRHAELVSALVREGGDGATVPLPHGLDIVRQGRRLLLARRGTLPLPFLPLVRGQPARHRGPEATVVITWTEGPGHGFDLDSWRARCAAPPAGPPWHAAIDADALADDAMLRGVLPQDTITPLGRASRIDVASWLGRQGLPELLRRGARVLASNDQILWVVGHRIDVGASITHGTRTIAYFTVDVRPTSPARP